MAHDATRERAGPPSRFGYHRAMRKVGMVLLLLSLARLASAQILETEVWVGSVDLHDGGFAVSNLKNISNHRGYDNQPSFYRDGTSLLFTTEASNLDETGLGVHAVRYDTITGKSTPLPQARGFSPTPMAGGKIMLLRQGGVWLHDERGKLLRALTDTKEAGYFTRFEDDRWVLFMNDKDRRIVLYDGMANGLETMITGAITAPYRVPGERAVTFVVEQKDVLTLYRLDIDSKQVTALGTIPFKTGGHHVWTPRGTIFIASGAEIHEWDPHKPTEWPIVHRFDDPDLQGITRIALNGTADRIAIVSTARDETVVRNSRAAANDAMTAALAKFRGTSYVRTIETLSMASDSATERGTWIRKWRGAEGPVEQHGRYTTVWHREIGGNGTPSWSVEAERTDQ
jgi:Tol biopolymer transport system component